MRSPSARATHGSEAAATVPPSGIAVCRIPRARPRSARPNQLITARPLAALTLAPKTPATASSPTSERKLPLQPRAASATAAPVSPATMTTRSPIRSATIPHGRRVSIIPALTAPSTTPICVRLSE